MKQQKQKPSEPVINSAQLTVRKEQLLQTLQQKKAQLEDGRLQLQRLEGEVVLLKGSVAEINHLLNTMQEQAASDGSNGKEKAEEEKPSAQTGA